LVAAYVTGVLWLPSRQFLADGTDGIPYGKPSHDDDRDEDEDDVPGM